MSPSVPALFTATGLGLSLSMAAAWALQRRTGQSGWIDATWSFSVGAAGAILALAPLERGAPTVRQIFVAAAVLTASLRLGLHIARRSVNASEDPRYAAFAREWGAAFPQRLFWFLQIQAVCALVLAATIFLAARNPAPLGGLRDGLGALLLLTAILGEGWADASLSRFRAEPSNRRGVCEKGPWAWSRHPNYFFEWLSWLGYALLAVDPSGAWPQGWLAFCGPLLMYWLLAHVSGVPPLEKHMVASRGDAYRRYQARVGAFFPWPPRKARAHVEESSR
jgi:steroid 5-alpha reductase family enzyme